MMDPPFKTARAQSELFDVQCDQWEPIGNSQLIGCYWHLVVKNGNFTFLLTSSGPEWQFHISTDI